MAIGRVHASAYAGNDGQPRASLEVTAESLSFLGGKNGNGNGAAGPVQGELEVDIQDEDIPFYRQQSPG